jgi:hypothetical protein
MPRAPPKFSTVNLESSMAAGSGARRACSDVNRPVSGRAHPAPRLRRRGAFSGVLKFQASHRCSSGSLAKFTASRRAPSLKHWLRQLALPNLAAARLPQQKIFDDPLVFAGRKRRTANPAHHLRVIGGLRTGLGFDNLIKSTATRASEMIFRGFDHAPTPSHIPRLH